MSDPTFLWKQNAPVEDVIEACRQQSRANDDVVRSTVKDLFESSVISLSYKARMAKLVQQSFNEDEELQDLAAEVLASSYLAPADNFCWVDYGETLIRLINPYAPQNTQLIGDVIGLLLWEAEICVLEWLEAHPEYVRDSKILEIGAGVGLAGFAAVQRLGAKNATLTDTNSKVLENLEVIRKRVDTGDSINVECLEWYDLNSLGRFKSHNLIIAADCLYDPNDVPTFVQMMKVLLNHPHRPVALLACSVRNRNTFQKLMDELNVSGFELEPSPVSPEQQRYSRRTTHMFTKDWTNSRVEIFLVRALQTLV